LISVIAIQGGAEACAIAANIVFSTDGSVIARHFVAGECTANIGEAGIICARISVITCDDISSAGIVATRACIAFRTDILIVAG